MNKIIRKASSVLGVKLDTTEMAAERKMLAKVSVTMKNTFHALLNTLQGQRHYRDTEQQIAPAPLLEGTLSPGSH